VFLNHVGRTAVFFRRQRNVASGPEILVEASVAETSKAPVAESRKQHPVVMDFENLQKLGNGGVEATASAASSFAGSFQMFAAEASEYSKKVLDWKAPFGIRATMPSLLTRSSWRIL